MASTDSELGRSHSHDQATIRLFWQTTLEHKRLLLLTAAYPISAVCLSTLVPLIIGKILAAMSRPAVDPLGYLPWFVAVALAGIITNRIGFVSLLTLQARCMSSLHSRTLDTLLQRSMGFHANNIGGKLISDATDFVQAFAMLTNALFVNLLPFVIILLSGAAVVFLESWKLGLLVLAMAGYALGSAYYQSRARSPLRARRLAANRATTGHLSDTVLNVQTVKTFASESRELRDNNSLNHRLRDIRVRDWTGAAREGNARIAVLLGAQLVFILLIVQLVKADPAVLGIGIFAFSLTITLNTRLFQINEMMRSVEDGLLQASPMTAVMQETPEIKDVAGARRLQVRTGGIRFENVDFHYADASSDEAIFSALDLDIKPGEKVGLVGPSGGGKTTLTRLLLRFDDVSAGSISIDDQDIARVSQSSLRSAVAYVPQEPLLFHRPVRENIAYGRPDATQADIVKAARQASADRFIESLPDGYDTVVGERGVKLSGGQRQRVAIARALLKDAPILVLDEATSALDSESEHAIQQALWKLMRGRTAIVVAHRLSTIQKLDRIIVLDNGRIVEQGTHDTLVNNGGLYAKLWQHQSGGFLSD